MLEIKKYTREEILEILRLKDNAEKKQIDGKLNRWGVEYSSTGRGKKCVYEIKTVKCDFDIFCMTELDFKANTDFYNLAIFIYMFFNDDDFRIQPFSEMSLRMGMNDTDTSRQTLSVWKKKLKNNHFYFESAECKYYSVSRGERCEISHDEYSKAWKTYFDYLEKHRNDGKYDKYAAFSGMYDMIGGRAVKRPLLHINAFEKKKINDLMLYTINKIEHDSKSGNP